MNRLHFLYCLVILFGLSACQSTTNDQKATSAGTEKAAATPSGPMSKGITLLVDDQTITSGQSVCLDVKVKDFQQVMSMQYTMHWDPKVLEYEKVDKLQLKDLKAGNFGASMAPKGMMGISWYDFDVKGITVPDNTSIYQVCFKAKGAAGSSSKVFFDGTPVAVEISNAAGEIIQFSSRRAYVTVQ
jgi:hypothetical protein